MFNIKDIKYYKEPIKLMQEQLKAYIFQTTLDRRRQEYLMNEQINDIKSEVHNRLLKLENQQRLNMESIANSINTGSYYNKMWIIYILFMIFLHFCLWYLINYICS